MKKRNSYLIFYVILAVGLALSWSQVSRRAQLVPNSQVSVMQVDAACEPQTAPCAAYAQHFALVLGPSGDHLKLVGQSLPEGVELHVQQLDLQARIMQSQPLVKALAGEAWSLRPLEGGGRLRVRLLKEGHEWLAEFPLL